MDLAISGSDWIFNVSASKDEGPNAGNIWISLNDSGVWLTRAEVRSFAVSLQSAVIDATVKQSRVVRLIEVIAEIRGCFVIRFTVEEGLGADCSWLELRSSAGTWVANVAHLIEAQDQVTALEHKGVRLD